MDRANINGLMVIVIAIVVGMASPVSAQTCPGPLPPEFPTEVDVNLLNLDGSNIDTSLLLTIDYLDSNGCPLYLSSAEGTVDWSIFAGKSNAYAMVPAKAATNMNITVDGYEMLQIPSDPVGYVDGTYNLNLTSAPTTTTLPTTTTTSTTSTTTLPTTTTTSTTSTTTLPTTITTSTTSTTTTTTIPAVCPGPMPPGFPIELDLNLLNLGGSNINTSLLLTIDYLDSNGCPVSINSTDGTVFWGIYNGKSNLYTLLPAKGGTKINITVEGYEMLVIGQSPITTEPDDYLTPLDTTTTTTTTSTTTTTTTTIPPALRISKIMTSGKTTVYTKTMEHWVLEIKVINDGLTNLSDVVVSDTIPEEITLDDFTASKGTVAATAKNGATKLTWTIGTTSPGDVETLVMGASTKRMESGMRTTQSFLEPGEYVLNQGASVSANGGQVTAGPTDPITVYAQATTRHRGRMGGGHHRSVDAGYVPIEYYVEESISFLPPQFELFIPEFSKLNITEEEGNEITAQCRIAFEQNAERLADEVPTKIPENWARDEVQLKKEKFLMENETPRLGRLDDEIIARFPAIGFNANSPAFSEPVFYFFIENDCVYDLKEKKVEKIRITFWPKVGYLFG